MGSEQPPGIQVQSMKKGKVVAKGTELVAV